jgi:hypothetical protein
MHGQAKRYNRHLVVILISNQFYFIGKPIHDDSMQTAPCFSRSNIDLQNTVCEFEYCRSTMIPTISALPTLPVKELSKDGDIRTGVGTPRGACLDWFRFLFEWLRGCLWGFWHWTSDFGWCLLGLFCTFLLGPFAAHRDEVCPIPL